MKYPVVLITSEGRETPENIINNIRKIPIDDEKEEVYKDSTEQIHGYAYDLTTKYYKTRLFLVPYEKNILLLPNKIREHVEAVLIYFDAGKRSFASRIPFYANYLKENEIDMGILLCDELFDDANEGITYKEAKQESKFLDVIELGRTKDEDDDEPVGYDELLQALRSCLWSNIAMGTRPNSQYMKVDESPPSVKSDEETAEGTQPENSSVEQELALFENLLTEVMMFKNATASWSRNERLAYAENFADKFDKLIGGENSSDSEN